MPLKSRGAKLPVVPLCPQRQASSLSLRPSFAFVDGAFRDDAIHQDIVRRGGNLREQLALEGQRDQRGVGPGMLQKFIVVALAVPHARSAAVERDAGDYDQVELLRLDLLGRQ